MKKMLAMILAAAMILAVMTCGAATGEEWKDFFCEEEQFRIKVPAGGIVRYEEENGGLVIYTEHDGYIPHLTVHRRAGDNKFKNPANYLNNVYREHLENKYGENSQGMNPASTWEIGGKELLGARYMFKIGEYDVVQLVLIEIRDAGDVEYSVKYIDGQGDAVMAAAEEAVRNYREADTEAAVPDQETEKDILKPADVSNTLVDNQNGTYWARITDTDKIIDYGYFTMDLYVQDIYPLDRVWALQEGDRVEINGKVFTVKSLQPEQDGRRELCVQEEIDGYIVFKKTSNTACIAVVNDWVPCTKVSTEKIMMPLPNDFRYVWLDQDGEIGETRDQEQFAVLVSNSETAPVLSQYNTMIRYENGLLMMIGHQDYPYGPDETEESSTAEKQTNTGETPFFMIPSSFVEYYNAMMEGLADQYAEQLGEDGVQIVRGKYTLTQTDPQGAMTYCGNSDWSVEAGFLYADAESASDTSPALVLNFTIKEGVPDGAALLSKYAFRMMIAYAYKDEVSTDELGNWFENVNDSTDIFTLPGYTLNYLQSGGQIQYAVLPPASQIPQLQP